MKKILLGTMLLAAVFVSCSKDSAVPDETGAGREPATRMYRNLFCFRPLSMPFP